MEKRKKSCLGHHEAEAFRGSTHTHTPDRDTWPVTMTPHPAPLTQAPHLVSGRAKAFFAAGGRTQAAGLGGERKLLPTKRVCHGVESWQGVVPRLHGQEDEKPDQRGYSRDRAALPGLTTVML